MLKVDEFYSKYEHEIKEKLKVITQEKKKENIYFGICILIPFIILSIKLELQYIMRIFEIDILNMNFINIVFAFVSIIAIAVYIIHSLLKKRLRTEEIKEEIFTQFIHECFESTTHYDVYSSFSKNELKKILEILPYFTIEYYLLNNYQTGIFEINLNGSNIKFGNINYSVRKRNKNGECITIGHRSVLGDERDSNKNEYN